MSLGDLRLLWKVKQLSDAWDKEAKTMDPKITLQKGGKALLSGVLEVAAIAALAYLADPVAVQQALDGVGVTGPVALALLPVLRMLSTMGLNALKHGKA